MKQIFINLPFNDLEKSKNFYTQLGFTNYSLFTCDNQVSRTWSEHILVMLQTKEFCNLGSTKSIGDMSKQLSASFTLTVVSLDRVDEIVAMGFKAVDKEPNSMIDEGYMQVRTLEDLNVHLWSFIHLDIDKIKKLRKENEE